MVKNVNAKQLEQELSAYLESGRKDPLFVASYTGMGKTDIVKKVISSHHLSIQDLGKFDGYRCVNPDNWKVVWFTRISFPDIELLVKERTQLPTIVEFSLPNSDFELEVNPIYSQYEDEEWLLYRPTFDEWIQWAEQTGNGVFPKVHPLIIDFVQRAGEKVLYNSILNGSYERELEMLNNAQLWPDKNYIYEGSEVTRTNEEKIKELYRQLSNLGEDEIGKPLDPRKGSCYTPRSWVMISNEFNDILKGILDRNNDIEWKYRGYLKKANKNDYDSNNQLNVLKEAIQHIPEEQWPDIVSQYCIGFRIHGQEITENEKYEAIKRVLINKIVASTKSEMSLPCVMFKEFLL